MELLVLPGVTNHEGSGPRTSFCPQEGPCPPRIQPVLPTWGLCGAMKYTLLIHRLIIGCLFIVCLLSLV